MDRDENARPPARAHPYQFGLRDVMIFVAVLAPWLLLIRNYSFYGPVSVFLIYPVGAIGAWLYIRTAYRERGRIFSFRAIGACALIAVVFVWFGDLWALEPLDSDITILWSSFADGWEHVDWRLLENLASATLLAIHFLVLLSALCVVLRFGRILRIAKAPIFISTVACLFAMYAAYPYIIGTWRDRRLTSDPNHAVVELIIEHHYHDDPPDIVVATETSLRTTGMTQHPYWEHGDTRKIIVSEKTMRRLLDRLRSHQFFNTITILHSLPISGGSVGLVRVRNRGSEHVVCVNLWYISEEVGGDPRWHDANMQFESFEREIMRVVE
jgi:hypothetical protein